MKKKETPPAGARERLLETGLRLFAAMGFEGVRTRALAEEAGVNQSAIPYYFKSKEGVYAAVIQNIAAELSGGLKNVNLLLEENGAPRGAGREWYAERLRELIRGVTALLLSSERSSEATSIIIREQLRPTAGFDLLFREFLEPLHKSLTICAKAIQPEEAGLDEAVIRAHSIIGQVLAFVVARNTYLRRAGLKHIGESEVEKIKAILAESCVNALRSGGRRTQKART